ncbi:thioredoxin isoform X1 [Apteryx rowi]|uniref:thioredoxin isoform X1 n=1 Tax=Apteryx rowi TaxID=308060 RepID=UPI000E1CD513|nr:thioredoxin isoform X1 [Apteryx rowi]
MVKTVGSLKLRSATHAFAECRICYYAGGQNMQNESLHVLNESEFEAELKSAGEKLVVVDFSATWCGPCKMIKPFFHSLCDKFADVVFIEIDVDDAQDVAAHCDVKCMPTFQFYKNGKKVQEFSGANKEKLEETIKCLV